MRGAPEGWEWVRIQSEPCPQCGQDPARLPVDALDASTVAEAARWHAFHARDMLVVFGERIEPACREDDPAVPWFDPGEEAWRAYNETDPASATTSIDLGGRPVFDPVASTATVHTARRDGVDRFNFAGFACSASTRRTTSSWTQKAHAPGHPVLDMQPNGCLTELGNQTVAYS
jgi:hypothetical protein